MKAQNAYIAALNFFLKKRGRGTEVSLSIDTGISQSHLNRIKRGERFGSIKTLEKIANALGSSYSEMVMLGEKLLGGDQIETDCCLSEKQMEYITHKYTDSRTEKIIEMVKQLDAEKDTQGISKLFGSAASRLEDLKQQKELRELREEVKRLKSNDI